MITLVPGASATVGAAARTSIVGVIVGAAVGVDAARVGLDARVGAGAMGAHALSATPTKMINQANCLFNLFSSHCPNRKL
jgi:hypothetical protein